MERVLERAKILSEALPFIQRFYGKIIVIKYGGAAMVEPELQAAFARDVVLMNVIGMRPVVVHGGGPKISETMARMGKEPEFVQGQRVTDSETMDIVEMVLGGLVNKTIVSFMNAHGGRAVGLTGKDGGLIRARRKTVSAVSPETGTPEIIDLGLVGEVEEVRPEVLETLKDGNFIPVIAPVGVGPDGESLNINADYVASAVATALGAEKLVLLTDVEGILDEKGHLIATADRKAIGKLVDEGTVRGGMLPKVQACLGALDGGVTKAHIIDGRIAHAVLLEVFTPEGVGTEILS